MKTFENLENQIASLEEENLELRRKLDGVQCYIGNVDQWIEKNEGYFVDANSDGKVDKLSFDSWKNILQNTWDAIKKSRSECAGKETVVKLPKNPIWAAILSAALSLTGFKL